MDLVWFLVSYFSQNMDLTTFVCVDTSEQQGMTQAAEQCDQVAGY